jgi:glycosyltransferase involved in cell wall biosynthesis
MKPKISIIVPIYNVEKYLEKCISSLLDQSFTDFELILVNDGSPDNCGKICDDFKEKDSRIKVIHLENGGVCRARNKGMELATGDFYVFVDSDDWVEKDFMKDFVDHIEDDETLIIQDCNRDNDEKSETHFFGFQNKSFVLKEDFGKLFHENAHYVPGGYPWNKLYSAKIIKENNLQFDPAIKLADDEKWNFEYLVHIKKLKFVENANYHYIYNPGSISNQARPFERELTRFAFKAKFFDFALKNYQLSEADKKKVTAEVERHFRINILDRIYKKEVSKEERISRLKEIAKLPESTLHLLQSDLKFRKLDYAILRSKNVTFFDAFKKLRLKLNA